MSSAWTQEWLTERVPADADWRLVRMVDLNMGESPALVVIYRSNGENRLLVAQQENRQFRTVADLTGHGYEVSALYAAPITAFGRANLIVGWRQGDNSKLSIYDWVNGQLRDIMPQEACFSYLEVEDMPAEDRRDGMAEMAIWNRSGEQSYQVQVVRWDGQQLVIDPSATPYYYRTRVVPYYQRLVEQFPEQDEPQLGLRTAQEHALTYAQRAEIAVEQSLRAELFPASERMVGGTRWGYINAGGQMKLPAIYDYANNFQPNHLAVIEQGGRQGLIDKSGRQVVKPIYDFIGNFSEGRASVADDNGYWMIDEQGRIITPRSYGYIGPLLRSRAVYIENQPDGQQYYGYLDQEGRPAIPATFLEAGDFTVDGKAVVKKNEQSFALIDTAGKQIQSYPYPFVGPLSNGLMSFQEKVGGPFGYIDEAGSIVISPRYQMALPFDEGRAVVNMTAEGSNKIGLIDRSGNIIIEPKYNDIQVLGGQRYAVGTAQDAEKPYLGSNYALANAMGGFLTPFHFVQMLPYQQEVASASDGKTTFFIDRNGNKVSNLPEVTGLATMRLVDSLVQVNRDLKLEYLNRQGDLVWSTNTVIPLNAVYAVEEKKFKPNPNYLVYYPQVKGMKPTSLQRNVNERLKEMSQVKEVGGGQLDYSYTGDFAVTWFKKHLLVLELNGYNYPFGAAHGMPSKQYAHLNLQDGSFYTLGQLFKKDSDYVKVLSDIVGKMIKEDPQYSYVFPDSYTGISPDQLFYVKEDALYLLFAPYEIAPFAVGFPTFRIPFSQISGIINNKGDFWRSFHSRISR